MGDLFDLIILDTRYYDRGIADGSESSLLLVSNHERVFYTKMQRRVRIP